MPGTVHLVVKEDISHNYLSSTESSSANEDKVKAKLKDMESKGIIEKMDEPSDWDSQMAVTVKKNGDLRICIDPRPLNKALKREHFPMPVLDDILPDLSKARVFSRLDLQDVANVASVMWWSEIFQKRLKTTLEGLESTECIADDIIVWGGGDSMEEARRDHDKNLEALMFRAHKQVNYLARFLPQLSTVMEPINRLTKEDVACHWEHGQDQALTKIKDMICTAPITILEYDIDLKWRPGKEMHVADMLSRSYLPKSTGMSDIEQVCMVDYLPIRTERLEQLKLETERDETLQLLRLVILKGWPEEKHQCPTQVTPYFSIRDELSVQDGLIFRGERLVIPASMRDQMKKAIHTSHLGEESCLKRAREAQYWPAMNAEIKTFISTCDTCRNYETSQCKETMMPHELPDKDYLVTSDYYTNFWEVDRLKRSNSSTIISKLKRHFARQGIPEQVISDNAQNPTSDGFQRFARDWDFEHVTVSPYNSKANGKAESSVKAAKRMLRKAKKSGTDPYLALLEIRNTPTQGMGSSPMQRLNNRRARTLLPMTPNLLKPRNRERSNATAVE
ncbi:PREDICTED: uncharacterized protein LOC106818112 [Priapulus caudatus]|uniref:RNA-directed DNA polymerase n=1 Tax=Priapulus caudatus TaxID=37621 RepID=A0ABM1F1K2_PRICU|nr:PREDICTED: uncharacterized protein LOC106818112 [Priapulus caudatus]